MRIKDKKVSIAARTLREFRQRDAAAYRRHRSACIAASKCRYRGYFSLAAASASGHYVADYVFIKPLLWFDTLVRGACPRDILDQWRGQAKWRQAKKLAARLLPYRPKADTWVRVVALPWRCIARSNI